MVELTECRTKGYGVLGLLTGRGRHREHWVGVGGWGRLGGGGGVDRVCGPWTG